MSLRDLVLRYRKDPRFIVSVPLVILAATSLVYYVTQQARTDARGAEQWLLLFVLWNINLLLIIGIVFVLLRGVVKLVLERRHGIIGSRFRTKLVVTYVATSRCPWSSCSSSRPISCASPSTAGSRRRSGRSSRTAKPSRRWRRTSRRRSPPAPRAIAASADSRDAAKSIVLSHVRQFHGVDMVAVYRAGILLKAQADPRAPIRKSPIRSNRFFEEVARNKRAVKIDVVARRQVDPHGGPDHR
jgi:predicted membrane protein